MIYIDSLFVYYYVDFSIACMAILIIIKDNLSCMDLVCLLEFLRLLGFAFCAC